MPDASSLVKKKTDYDAKILNLENKVTNKDHDKNINTSEFNKLTTENFKATLAKASLVTKTDFDDKQKSLNKKNTPNKTKHLLVENKFEKLQNLMWLILEAKIILTMMA